MGIPDLWVEAEKDPSALVPVSLTHLIVSSANGLLEDEGRLPLMGIDASPWMYQAQGAVMAARRAGASWSRTGISAEVTCLRKRVEQLLHLPVTAVFFFDGDRRPAVKRSTRVNSTSHPLAEHLKDLARASGFGVHQAPGEAEADLAYYNSHGDLDFVMTSDSDIFMFGAHKIVWSPRESRDWDKVEFYPVEQMRQHNQALSKEGLVFVAVLAGGDYNQTGLAGCGFPTAYALARSDLPTDLFAALDAYKAGDRTRTVQCLARFRRNLQDELCNNKSGLLSSRHPRIGSHIPDNFPNLDTVHLYAYPITSESLPRSSSPTDSWQAKLPDVDKMIEIYGSVYPNWKWRDVFNTLSSSVFTGSSIRQLAQPRLCGVDTPERFNCLGTPAIMAITGTNRELCSQELPFPIFSVRLCLTSVSKHAIDVFKRETFETVTPRQGVNASSTVISIPGPILCRAAPAMVETYLNEGKMDLGVKSCGIAQKGKKRQRDEEPPSRVSSGLGSVAGPSKATPSLPQPGNGKRHEKQETQCQTRVIWEKNQEIIEILDEL
ncbi:PIN domain-like protein [Coprinopsis sp. MPI-PUGE-AT-0042]|nr:PIN domain-like protein [Coprinopsis sp. MPI-PUGE-AT-0042]